MTDKRNESQFNSHNCPGCPDTSEFDKLLQPGTNPLFHGWAKAAKEQAVAGHKFDIAARNYLKNR